MKYCEKCRARIETQEFACPVCGEILVDIPADESDAINEYEAAEIVSTMMTTGIL